MDYPCYVKIKSESQNEDVALPTEEDGTLLLTSVASQFPGALGLRYQSESGSWRGVSLNGDNVLVTPIGGWGSVEYHIIMPKRADKRNVEEDSDDEDDTPLGKLSRMSEREILSDLVLRNLPFTSTEDELKTYFTKFGEVKSVVVKLDGENKSRGFGFIGFKTVDAIKACLSEEDHVIKGRNVEVTLTKRKGDQDDDIPTTKLFVGSLPPGTTKGNLKEMFSKFGELTDAYIPKPFKGYGFVTYKKKKVVRKVLKADHILKGRTLNVNIPQTEKFKRISKNANPYNAYNKRPADFDPSKQGFRNQGPGNNYGSRNQGPGNQGPDNQRPSKIVLDSFSTFDSTIKDEDQTPVPPRDKDETPVPPYDKDGSLKVQPCHPNATSNHLVGMPQTQSPLPSASGSPVANALASLNVAQNSSGILSTPSQPCVSTTSQLCVSTPSQHCVYISGLQRTHTESTLDEIFAPFGDIFNVQAVRKIRGRGRGRRSNPNLTIDDKPCRGFGFVNFTKLEDAYRAISSLNGSVFQGNVLQVKMREEI